MLSADHTPLSAYLNPPKPKNLLFTNRALRKMMIPLMIEQFLIMSVGMIDTAMVSNVGEAAISGISLVDMISVLIIQLFSALCTGGAVVVSQYLGANDNKQANSSASQLVLMSALLGVVLTGFSLLFAPVLVGNVFGALAPDVYAAGLLYLQITALSFPFLALYNAGAAIFRSMGNSVMPMYISLLMNIINLIGNAICILWLKMGVAGAAIPTVAARVVACLIILYQVSKRSRPIYVSPTRKIAPALARRILTIGIPSAFENALFQLGKVLVVGMIATFGTSQITANAVSWSLNAVGCIPYNALVLTMITVVGQCIGAQDHAAVIYYARKLVRWAHVLGAAFNITLFLLLPYLLNLYTLTPETRALTYTITAIHVICAIFLWPLSFVLPNALRAASDIRFAMYVSVSCMVFCRLLVGYILCIVLGYGIVGIWWAMILDWVCRLFFMIPRYLSGKWKTKYIPEPSEAPAST